MRTIQSLLLIILFSSNIFSQKVLTLDESLAIALGESYSIKSAKYNLESSSKNLEAIKLGLRTSIDLQFDLPSYQRSLVSQFNTATGNEEFYKVGNTTIEGRLFVTQPLLFSNGTVSIVGKMLGRDQFNDFSGTTRDYFSNLSIQLRQPLFVFNNQKANLERAEIRLKKTERNYNQTEREIIFNVTTKFFRLYQAKKNVEIAKNEVTQTEETYRTAVNKYKAGLIPEVESLQLEVDFATSQNELLRTEQTFAELLNEFKFLIGLELSEVIDVKADIEFSDVYVDLDEAIEHALEARAELLNSESDIELNEMNIDEIDARRTIRVDLFANYGINKNDEKFKYIFRDFQDSRSVVMSMSVPILDWGQNSRNVEAAVANYKNSVLAYNNLKESIKNEIISSYNRVNSSQKRVEVLSKTVEIAEKSYEQNLERFRSGNITSFELSQEQLRLTKAKSNSLNALIDYKIALADLERKSYLKYN
ncbi:MAG: TolC family protein [Ignavibacteriae bacterium]|nr:TolC family protein [Ignavibacteriota bacterium]